MTNLSRVVLGPDAVAHAAERLQAFTNLNLDLRDSFPSWTVVPGPVVGTVEARQGDRKFLDGVGGEAPPVRALLPLVLEHLNSSATAVAVFVHPLVRAHEPLLRWAPVRVSNVDDFAVCILDRETRSAAYVAAAIHEFFQHYFVAVFGSSKQSAYDLHRALEWPRDVLAETLGSWTTLMVDAFDEESFVAVDNPA